MANLSPISSWTAADAAHFARRAGFGVAPEAAAALAAQPPASAIDAWIDGTGLDTTLFEDVWATRADPVTEAARSAGTGGVAAPAVLGPHRYLVDGPDAWRNSLSRAQASWAFRMQYNPYAFAERMALFWHNLFATGFHKVNRVAPMLRQIATLRAHGLDRFDDLLVLVSKDPAMCIWLDSVLNNAAGSSVPNENYAREVMELYSLGADNGYSQQDVTELARALSGWSFAVRAADVIVDPTNPGTKYAADAVFALYDGSDNPAGPDGRLWYDLSTARAKTSSMHGSGAITFLGRSFDIAQPPTGMTPGEDALRSIVASRGPNCAQFLAKRLLTHFVAPRPLQKDLDDAAAMIQASGFDMRAVMKTLLKSQFFFDANQRFALVEGPVSWIVRAARMLGMDLATADAQPTKGFPAWAQVGSNNLDQAGMRLLDPSGPNGWQEDVAWLNSSTVRFRTRLAAAVALAEASGGYTIFPTSVAAWFPSPPGSPSQVLDRLVSLLQPGPIPDPVKSAWLSALWPAAFAWDAASQNKARELAYLILCSPAGQLY